MAPTIPAEPQQPLFPPFDKDLDTESSGDGIDADAEDDDEDDGDDKDYDYNKELDKEIDIDGPEPGHLPPVVHHNTVETGHIPTTDEIDVDGGDEDDNGDSDIDGPRIGGNDGDITERGRQWFLFSSFNLLTFQHFISFIFIYVVLCYYCTRYSLCCFYYCTSFVVYLVLALLSKAKYI